MDKDTYINFIIKSLSDELSGGEKEIFAEWLASDIHHRRLFEKIRVLWEQSYKSYENIFFNEEDAKTIIRNKIRSLQERSKIRILRLWLPIAASLLILLGLSLAFIPKISGNRFLIYASGNNIREIMLPDSSKVWLNEKSTLSVPSGYADDHRFVKLEGEAYFEIRRNEDAPFKVHAGKTIVKVLGTSFNVNIEKNTGNVDLVVNSGQVAFYRINSIKHNILLTGGMQGIYFARLREITVKKNENTNFLSWKTGIISFKGAPMKEVCRTLSTYYKKRIETDITDSSLLLTGSFQHETLDEVLNTLILTLDVKIDTSGNNLLLQKQL
jgi:transmembrane sensor